MYTDLPPHDSGFIYKSSRQVKGSVCAQSQARPLYSHIRKATLSPQAVILPLQIWCELQVPLIVNKLSAFADFAGVTSHLKTPQAADDQYPVRNTVNFPSVVLQPIRKPLFVSSRDRFALSSVSCQSEPAKGIDHSVKESINIPFHDHQESLNSIAQALSLIQYHVDQEIVLKFIYFDVHFINRSNHVG